jgi:hypothetical protein
MPHPTTATQTSAPTIAAVLAQEQLLPQVTALMKQLEKLPPRQQLAPASAVTLAAANALFITARKVLGRAAPDPVTEIRTEDLSVLLAALSGALEGFEARHSGPDRGGVLVWKLSDGPSRPVTRHLGKWLRGANGFPVTSERDNFDADAMRKKVLRRFLERENIAYADGYRDAREGLPPRPDRGEIEAAGPAPSLERYRQEAAEEK